MSLPQHLFLGSVSNNSAIVVVQEQQLVANKAGAVGNGIPQHLLCQSALLGIGSNCGAHWLDPSNSSVGQYVRERDSEKTMFNSVRLDLDVGMAEGMYTCLLKDEKQVEQKLYVGVYQDGMRYAVVVFLIFIKLLLLFFSFFC